MKKGRSPLIAQGEIGGSIYDIESSKSFKFSPNLADRRERLAFYLDTTKFPWAETTDGFLSFYDSNLPYNAFKLQLADFILAIVLLVQHLPAVYISFDRVGTLFSLYTILTFAATIPVICAFAELDKNKLTYFGAGYWIYAYPTRFWRLKHSLSETLEPNKNFVFNLSSATHKGVHILVSVIVILVTVSAWNFNGMDVDIVPDNTPSRIATLAILVIGAIYVPSSLSDFFVLLKQQSKYDKPYTGERNTLFKHVVLAGNIVDVGALRSFLREFFCEDHGPQTITTKLVILQPFEPSDELQLTLNDVAYKSKVQYVKGSALSFRSLEKVKASSAEAFFLLTSKFGTDGDLESIDAATEHVLCIDSYKLGILSQNALAPGFINLITMLTTSFKEESKKEFLYKDPKANEWLEDYTSGLTHEIYTVRLSIKYRGQLFQNLASYIYQKYNTVLLGICHNSNDSYELQISLNPINYVVEGDELTYLITSEKFLADEIANGETFCGESFITDFNFKDILSLSDLEECDIADDLNTDDVTIDIPHDTEETPLLENFSSAEKEFVKDATDEMIYSENVERMRQNISGAMKKCHDDSKFDLVYRGPKIKAGDVTLNKTGEPASLKFLSNLTQDSTFYNPENIQFLPENVKDHVLISTETNTDSVKYFVAVFRHKDPNTPIVLLSTEKPGDGLCEENDDNSFSNQSWKYFETYSNIYHVSGTPLKRKDLIAAKVENISSAIILCDPFIYESGNLLAEAAALHSLLSIEEMSPKDVFISIEFVHEENMKIIGKDDFDTGPRQSTLENFGAIATPSFIGGAEPFHTDAKVQGSPSHSPSHTRNSSFTEVNKLDSQKFSDHGNIYQIELPKKFKEKILKIEKINATKTKKDQLKFKLERPKKTNFLQKFFPNNQKKKHEHTKSLKNLRYIELFQFLLTKNCLSLALYRQSKGAGVSQRYVVLNPKSDTELRSDDKIFVLSRFKLVEK
ncbi:hypothetical protein HK099_003615 [Clydaea vesicula]|uniref:Calcium-activated potassium channel BK alpha subunit domain-containing protein n=1 Tax=Clydaea vesicula TaxID=447962 RepID=A0AAD5Y063_9FUNG|nr:hypothetical protein HK099_003615 [Clydaea vesicula]